MSETIRGFRWWLACRLSKLACRLRAQKWYAADNMAHCYGNRAAELKQTIWERMVGMTYPTTPKDDEIWLSDTQPLLDELGQMAGENWGHRK